MTTQSSPLRSFKTQLILHVNLFILTNMYFNTSKQQLGLLKSTNLHQNTRAKQQEWDKLTLCSAALWLVYCVWSDPGTEWTRSNACNIKLNTYWASQRPPDENDGCEFALYSSDRFHRATIHSTSGGVVNALQLLKEHLKICDKRTNNQQTTKTMENGKEKKHK